MKSSKIQKIAKMVKIKYMEKFLKISKNHLKTEEEEKMKEEKKLNKKFYPRSFLILGGHDWTRALQSSLFQNPGWGCPLSLTEEDRAGRSRKSWCLI